MRRVYNSIHVCLKTVTVYYIHTYKHTHTALLATYVTSRGGRHDAVTLVSFCRQQYVCNLKL